MQHCSGHPFQACMHARAQVDEAGVWTELGHAQLEAGAVNDAIGSYLRSGDSSRYLDVIARSQVWVSRHWVLQLHWAVQQGLLHKLHPGCFGVGQPPCNPLLWFDFKA